MKVFIAGEGTDEIGNFAQDPAYRPSRCQGGVIEALLRKVREKGWTIVDGCPWRRIRKFAVGRDLHGRERRNVLGLVDHAVEAGCDIVVFVRDRDGEKARSEAIDSAICAARALTPDTKVIGGTAVEAIDGWIIACLGHTRSEDLTDPKAALMEEFNVLTGEQKAEAVNNTILNQLPQDARSLRAWLKEATETLSSIGLDQ